MSGVLKATQASAGVLYLIEKGGEEKLKKIDAGFYEIIAGEGNGLPANTGAGDIIHVKNELDLKLTSAVKKLNLTELVFTKSHSINYAKEQETFEVWGSDTALAVGSASSVISGTWGGMWLSDNATYQKISGNFIKTIDMTGVAPVKTEASGQTLFFLFGKNEKKAKTGDTIVYYYLPCKINTLDEPQEDKNVIEVTWEFTVDGAFKPMRLLVKK